MNQIPEIEDWKKLAREKLAPNVTYIDPKFKEVASWAEELLNAFWVEQQKDLDAFIDTFHQQLQKAREGLKARIELLLENNTARDNMDFSHGYRNALLDIESYLSELDQDKQ